jgi:hypothetical protein
MGEFVNGLEVQGYTTVVAAGEQGCTIAEAVAGEQGYTRERVVAGVLGYTSGEVAVEARGCMIQGQRVDKQRFVVDRTCLEGELSLSRLSKGWPDRAWRERLTGGCSGKASSKGWVAKVMLGRLEWMDQSMV